MDCIVGALHILHHRENIIYEKKHCSMKKHQIEMNREKNQLTLYY
jgi:hypothetical protein